MYLTRKIVREMTKFLLQQAPKKKQSPWLITKKYGNMQVQSTGPQFDLKSYEIQKNKKKKLGTALFCVILKGERYKLKSVQNFIFNNQNDMQKEHVNKK